MSGGPRTGHVCLDRRRSAKSGPRGCSRPPNMISAPSPAGPRPSTNSSSPTSISKTFTSPASAPVAAAPARGSKTPSLKTYEKGAIVATLNTPSFLGQRGATITVVLDKPFYAEVQLHVSGYIRSDVVFEPGSVQLGDLEQGTATQAESHRQLRRPQGLEDRRRPRHQ